MSGNRKREKEHDSTCRAGEPKVVDSPTVFALRLCDMPRVLVALAILSSFACGKATPKDAVDPGKVVARIDDHVITVEDVEQQIQKQPPMARARYSSVELRKELLDSLVRFEVMAREAKKRGYDKDPEVLRAFKQQMVNQMVQRDLESKVNPEAVPETEARKYYESHPLEFSRPEEVRVSQIVLKDQAKASRVLADLKRLAPTDSEAFKQMALKHSADELSRLRGGDLLFFDRKTAMHPRPVVEAAFTLEGTNQLSPIVESEKGFHILKLTGKREAFTRSFDEAKPEIQRRLLHEGRGRRIKDWVEEMRRGQKVEVFAERLKDVKLNPPTPPPVPPRPATRAPAPDAR
jgi:peptidyl-prolyl cis-trans isomerase C